MFRSRWAVSSFLIAVSLASPCRAADEDAALKALLAKTASVDIKCKTAAGVAAEIAKIAGVPVEFNALKRDAADARYMGASQSSSEANGLKYSTTGLGYERIYVFSSPAPVALQTLLDVFADGEGIAYQLDNGKLKFTPLAERPFDPLRAVAGKADIPAETDWQSVVRESVQPKVDKPEAADPRQMFQEAKRRNSAGWRSIGALKAHPQNDAVRALLLADAAVGIMQRHSTGNLLSIESAVAAAAEARRILASPGATDGLKELAGILRPALPQLAAATDEQLLRYQAGPGYMAAARACAELPDRAAAAGWAAEAAHLRLALGDDSLINDCYGVLAETPFPNAFAAPLSPAAGAALVKAAREDLELAGKFPAMPKEMLARFHYRLAHAAMTQNDPAPVIESLKAALNLDPVNGGYCDPFQIATQGHVAVELARIMKAAKKDAEAIDVLKKYAQPGDSEAANLLGLVLEDAGRKDDAIACYKKLAELKPDDDNALTRIAVLEGRAKVYTDVFGAKHTEVPELEQRKAALKALNVEVAGLFAQQNFDGVLQKVREGLKQFPTNATLRNQEVIALVLLNRPDEARTALDRNEKTAKYKDSLIGNIIEALKNGNKSAPSSADF